MLTSKQKAVKEVAVQILQGINFFEDKVSQIIGYSDFDQRFMIFCVEEDLFEKDELERIIHIRLLKLGRDCLENDCKKHWADHVRSPHALAYAIKHGEIRPSEYKLIQFDHGETPKTFYRKEIDGLVDRIIKDLLPKKRTLSKVGYMREPRGDLYV